MGARDRLLDFMKNKTYRPLTEKELMREFNVPREQREIMSKLLKDLVKEGAIYKSSNGRFSLPEKMDLIVGRIDGNQKGFGFLIAEDPAREDIFIARENLKGAMHNDKVLVRLISGTRGKRQEGEVVKILERANKRIVGNFEKSKYFGFVVPDNKRLFYDLFIPKEGINGAKQDQKVVAEIVSWPEKNRNPEGRIVEILGDKGAPGVDIESIIRQLDLPRSFPVEVEVELDKIPDKVLEEELVNRKDLRELPMVTIDGEDAKDLDDAVSMEDLGEGKVRLGVHIADVSHYVKEGTALDKEALERGTSIYLVDRVIPMLPPKLSNGICSLNPGEDRLTLSVFISYQLEPFKLLEYEITPSVIRSKYRMTYTVVKEILVNRNPEVEKKYEDFLPQLHLMNQLREKLRQERFEKGSINFQFPEVRVILNEMGKPVEIRMEEHGIAEQLIEEFMIAANRVVSEDMSWKQIPFIYRVHEQPDLDRLQEFNAFIHNFGYFLKGIQNQVHPRALQNLLDEVEGKPEERVINTLLLRSMKKAVYAPSNIGHFGLAIDFYSHFTAPIRRYPDLMIHRIIKESLTMGVLPEKRIIGLEKRLPHIAEHCSLQERRAMEAERDSVELKKLEYMVDKVGQEFDGIINGITTFGFFVELENTVEGLVRVENLKDDYYIYNEKMHCLVGEHTGKVYRFGDKVRVMIDKIDLDEREIDFLLLE
ncbi:MAG: ribonuclease R [Halanaerobiales bacterium]|jgi:ribonuclease R|nr:ribonuclease R [Halanaerobiales bacterium]HPZ61965.1 ribonuclease R [Halanaerobiales bacterium]HQD03312.1 ribonuclease R [Halanaerobiales bacterium]